ncbi:MAG: hypothetical protein PF588_06045 [Candidatus Kapabacteria bacterium]|jgi:hypothetical protein|nr:hypothetical protein [Candidatus Kapabacteria bacterium]
MDINDIDEFIAREYIHLDEYNFLKFENDENKETLKEFDEKTDLIDEYIFEEHDDKIEENIS